MPPLPGVIFYAVVGIFHQPQGGKNGIHPIIQPSEKPSTLSNLPTIFIVVIREL